MEAGTEINYCLLKAHGTNSSHTTLPSVESVGHIQDLGPIRAPCCCMLSFHTSPALPALLCQTAAHPSRINSDVSSSGYFPTPVGTAEGFLYQLPQLPSHITITELLLCLSAAQGKSLKGRNHAFFFLSCSITSEAELATQYVFSLAQSILNVHPPCTVHDVMCCPRCLRTQP